MDGDKNFAYNPEIGKVELHSVSSRLLENLGNAKGFLNFANKRITQEIKNIFDDHKATEWITHPFLMVERT